MQMKQLGHELLLGQLKFPLLGAPVSRLLGCTEARGKAGNVKLLEKETEELCPFLGAHDVFFPTWKCWRNFIISKILN
jgi:hypothetical protein